MAMNVDLRPGETLTIGDVRVTMVQKSGRLARLVIDADKAIPITHGTGEPAPRKAPQPRQD